MARSAGLRRTSSAAAPGMGSVRRSTTTYQRPSLRALQALMSTSRSLKPRCLRRHGNKCARPGQRQLRTSEGSLLTSQSTTFDYSCMQCQPQAHPPPPPPAGRFPKAQKCSTITSMHQVHLSSVKLWLMSLHHIEGCLFN